METEAAIDMAIATVSGDQIDVAFSRGSNEAAEAKEGICRSGAILDLEF